MHGFQLSRDINDMELAADIRDRLICRLKRAMENLRKSDYEDNNSQTYYMLNQFVEVNNGVKLDSHQSAKLTRSIDALKATLCST